MLFVHPPTDLSISVHFLRATFCCLTRVCFLGTGSAPAPECHCRDRMVPFAAVRVPSVFTVPVASAEPPRLEQSHDSESQYVLLPNAGSGQVDLS